MPRTVTEELDPGDIPLYRHPEWRDRLPWLVQGTTGRGEGEDAFDLGLFGRSPIGPALERWAALRRATGARVAIHARQVHGVEIAAWEADLPAGLFVAEGLDGHLTDRTGMLLAVSVADCIPIFLADETSRTVAVVHAGWRGVAAGGLEAMVRSLEDRGIDARGLWLHSGPSICGACYEVGPEVHAAVNPGQTPSGIPTPIDLRAAVAGRARVLGVPDERITLSSHCTRCGPGDFFSHRGGSPARQMGVLGRVE